MKPKQKMKNPNIWNKQSQKTLNQNKKSKKAWNSHLGNNSTFMQKLTKHVPVQVRFEGVFLLFPRWDMLPQR